ncbi:Aminomethyltransferase folate-binding domain-containing protein, partial [Coniophora puteana RWD-64-598 SS2]
LRGLLRTTPTLSRVLNRAVLSVSGSQASEFLNGILATHVSGRPHYAALLHAQGRVIHDVFIYRHESPKTEYLIEYDASPSEASELVALLKRYVLRAKVRVRDVSSEWDVWARWGGEVSETRSWEFAKSGSIEPSWAVTQGEWPWGSDYDALNDRRAPGMGRRMLVVKDSKPQDASTHDIVSSGEYTLHRILHGVPEGSAEIQPMHAFPMESNMDIMGGLDFRKGCYIGQELTVRTYHTGVVRKRILPVVLYPEGLARSLFLPRLPTGLSITPSAKSRTDVPEGTRVPRPRGHGTLLSSLTTQDTALGLALLRLEHVQAAERGDIELLLDGPVVEGVGEISVNHWWPDWWPTQ